MTRARRTRAALGLGLAVALAAVMAPAQALASAHTSTVRCEAHNTQVSAAPIEGSGAAGHYSVAITVTNHGLASCTLHGFPGVSMVYGDHGTQLGAPAIWAGHKGRMVVVAPGQSASTEVRVTQAGNVCDPVDARGLRVYLPWETRSQYAPLPMQGCHTHQVSLMRVKAFGA